MSEPPLPKRKSNRLAGWDYGDPGVYFLTLCVKDRRQILGRVVGASCARPPEVCLSPAGRLADSELQKWSSCYPGVSIDKYVVMPNHIHVLLRIENVESGRAQLAPTGAGGEVGESGRAQLAPTVSRMVQQFKGAVTKQLGSKIWQKSFHDHIVRDEQDYLALWQYIDGNPSKWQEDRYYEA